MLDLNKFSEYLGYYNAVSGEEAFKLWKELFILMNNFYVFLDNISNDSKAEWTTQLIEKCHGRMNK